LDALRGLAALWVCLFHFSHGGTIVSDGLICGFMKIGHHGVDIFFVLSGYLVPHLLWSRGHNLGKLPEFLWRRLARLHPPFMIANVLVIALNFASWLVVGPPVSGAPSWSEVSYSLITDSCYISGALDRPWINVVAWTLAVEVQFYLFSGFLMALVPLHHPRLFAIILILLTAGSPALVAYSQFLQHLPTFVFGWAIAFHQHTSSEDKSSWKSTLLLLLTAATVNLIEQRWMTLLFAAATAICTVLPSIRFPRWLRLAGLISYSLYLVHVPVGGRVINLGGRVAQGDWQNYMLIGLSLIVSILFATAFWRLVEVPSQRLSRWKRRRPFPAIS